MNFIIHSTPYSLLENIDWMAIQLQVILFLLITVLLVGLYSIMKAQQTKKYWAVWSFFLAFFWLLLTALYGFIALESNEFKTTEHFMRLADQFSVVSLIFLSIFSTTMLYETPFMEETPRRLNIITIVIGGIMMNFFRVFPVKIIQVGTFQEFTYYAPMNYILSSLYFILILPSLFVFHKLKKQHPQEIKYSLYFYGIILLIIEYAFDFPGTFPELLFLWRLCVIVGISFILYAGLIKPKIYRINKEGLRTLAQFFWTMGEINLEKSNMTKTMVCFDNSITLVPEGDLKQTLLSKLHNDENYREVSKFVSNKV